MSDDETSEARRAFDAWWAANGYSEPEMNAPEEAWDRYHLRLGVAWMGFAAGLQAGQNSAAARLEEARSALAVVSDSPESAGTSVHGMAALRWALRS
jgi:hypothetical protein